MTIIIVFTILRVIHHSCYSNYLEVTHESILSLASNYWLKPGTTVGPRSNSSNGSRQGYHAHGQQLSNGYERRIHIHYYSQFIESMAHRDVGFMRESYTICHLNDIDVTSQDNFVHGRRVFIFTTNPFLSIINFKPNKTTFRSLIRFLSLLRRGAEVYTHHKG